MALGGRNYFDLGWTGFSFRVSHAVRCAISNRSWGIVASSCLADNRDKVSQCFITINSGSDARLCDRFRYCLNRVSETQNPTEVGSANDFFNLHTFHILYTFIMIMQSFKKRLTPFNGWLMR